MKKRRPEFQSCRVVAHIDLDCFYVQVERSINSSLNHKPVAVVQYNPFGDLKSLLPTDNREVKSGGLIAVSYEARANGVKRIMRGAEALKACPELILVQVPTSNGKADLKIYRDASSRIVSVLGERYPLCVLERASIDEVYLDVTGEAAKLLETMDLAEMERSVADLVGVPTLIAGEDSQEMNLSRSELRKGHDGQGELAGVVSSDIPSNSADQCHQHSWFNRPISSWTVEDKLLLCASVLIRNIRRDVLTKLGFTCSAGIAHNKMLAKLASAMHKPNKQTLVPQSVIANLMTSLPLSRIQGLGGKLGQAVEAEFGDRIKVMGDLLRTDRMELVNKFGEESAQWMLDAAKGIDAEPVKDRALPISIGCSKSYRSTQKLKPANLTDGVILKWYGELAQELHSRVQFDTETNSREPKRLHVGLSVVEHDEAAEREREERKAAAQATGAGGNITVGNWFREAGFAISKIVPMVAGGPEVIARTALSVISRALAEHPRMMAPRLLEGHFRITSLSLGANNFISIESGAGAISSFFKAAAPGSSINDVTNEFVKTEGAVSPAFKRSDAKSGNKNSLSVYFKDTASNSSSGSTFRDVFESSSSFAALAAVSAKSQQQSATNNNKTNDISTFFARGAHQSCKSKVVVCEPLLRGDDDGEWERWEDFDDSAELGGNDTSVDTHRTFNDVDDNTNQSNLTVSSDTTRLWSTRESNGGDDSNAAANTATSHGSLSASHSSVAVGGAAVDRAAPRSLQPASAEELDPEVFRALPPDIQREVQRALRLASLGSVTNAAGSVLGKSKQPNAAMGSRKKSSGHKTAVSATSSSSAKHKFFGR